MSHYVLFTGGRDVHGPTAVEAMVDILTFMNGFYGAELRVMHGGARGVDAIAGTVAADLGITCKEFPADWSKGKKAGIERNEKMGSLLVAWENQGHSVEVIAFPGGRGTAHMVRFAGQLGLDITEIPLKGHGVTVSG